MNVVSGTAFLHWTIQLTLLHSVIAKLGDEDSLSGWMKGERVVPQDVRAMPCISLIKGRRLLSVSMFSVFCDWVYLRLPCLQNNTSFLWISPEIMSSYL